MSDTPGTWSRDAADDAPGHLRKSGIGGFLRSRADLPWIPRRTSRTVERSPEGMDSPRLPPGGRTFVYRAALEWSARCPIDTCRNLPMPGPPAGKSGSSIKHEGRERWRSLHSRAFPRAGRCCRSCGAWASHRRQRSIHRSTIAGHLPSTLIDFHQAAGGGGEDLPIAVLQLGKNGSGGSRAERLLRSRGSAPQQDVVQPAWGPRGIG